MTLEQSIVEQVGGQRFLSDKRQFAGLLFGLGIAAMFQPLGDVAGAIGPDGTTVTTGIPFSLLFAGLSVTFLGLVGAIVGYLQLVHDWGNKYLTGFAICTCQLAFIAYFTNITAVGRAARTGAAFIPSAFNPTPGDVKFVGAMGILSVFAYGFTSIGAISFMEFALFAYQSGKHSDRGGLYFFGRMSFYTFMLTLAGLSQLMLGCYVLHNFGSGPLAAGPVKVAVYLVNFPEISIFVGLIQLINGLWGLIRSVFGMAHWGPGDNSYAFVIAAQWIFMLVLQILTQVSYLPADAGAAAAPAIACLSLGLNVMPAFLDYKMRNLPAVIEKDYYGPEPEMVEKQSLKAVRESIITARSSMMKAITTTTPPDNTIKELDDENVL